MGSTMLGGSDHFERHNWLVSVYSIVESGSRVDRLDPTAATTWTMFAGVIFLIPLALPETSVLLPGLT